MAAKRPGEPGVGESTPKPSKASRLAKDYEFVDKEDATLLIKVGGDTIFLNKDLKTKSDFIKDLVQADGEDSSKVKYEGHVPCTVIIVPLGGPSADAVAGALSVALGRGAKGEGPTVVSVNTVGPLLEAARYFQLDDVLTVCDMCIDQWVVGMPDKTGSTKEAREASATMLGSLLSLSAEYELEAFDSLVRFLKNAMPVAMPVRQELRIKDFASRAKGFKATSEAFSFDGHKLHFKCCPRDDDEGHIAVFLGLSDRWAKLGDKPALLDATYHLKDPTGGKDATKRHSAFELNDGQSDQVYIYKNKPRAELLKTFVAADGSLTVGVDVRKPSGHCESIAKMALRSTGFLGLDDGSKLKIASAMLGPAGVHLG